VALIRFISFASPSRFHCKSRVFHAAFLCAAAFAARNPASAKVEHSYVNGIIHWMTARGGRDSGCEIKRDDTMLNHHRALIEHDLFGTPLCSSTRPSRAESCSGIRHGDDRNGKAFLEMAADRA
jgi:hypothetical protein